MGERAHPRAGLSVERALRARDVNRPTAEDLAEAEQTIQLVRTSWRPPPNEPKR
jgi:hypothetical protein